MTKKYYNIIGIENNDRARRPRGTPIVVCSLSGAMGVYGDDIAHLFTFKEAEHYCSHNWQVVGDAYECFDGTKMYIVPTADIEIVFAELKLKWV
jgi:hypothetical protein